MDSGFSWNPQTYSCIVKQGDPDWLNFVNVAIRESMTGTHVPGLQGGLRALVRRVAARAEDRLPVRVPLAVAYAAMGYSLQFGAIWASFDKLLSGLAIGLGLAIAAVACGTVIGLVAAFASIGPSRIARAVVAGYVMLIRNLPLLVLVLIVYFALPQLGIRFGKYESFIGALALYSGAYLTEVFRAGLASVPKGVVEASRAIGLTRIQTNVVGRRADHAAQCLAVHGQYLHRHVQGQFDRCGDRHSRADVSGAQDQRGHVPCCGGMDRGERTLHRDLLCHRRTLAPSRTRFPEVLSPYAGSFLNQVWIARWPLWDGFLLTIEIAAAAILFGTVLAVHLPLGSSSSSVPPSSASRYGSMWT